MKRPDLPIHTVPHGRTLFGTEPVVYHCNYYNFWLQQTVLLHGEDRGRRLLVEAAHAASAGLLRFESHAQGDEKSRSKLASDAFAGLGFGMIDLGAITEDGGPVRVPVSHYGTAVAGLRDATDDRPTSYFDAGFAAAAAEFALGLPRGSFAPSIEACQSQGAPEGRVHLARKDPGPRFAAPGVGPHGDGASGMPSPNTAIDEDAIIDAVSGLDLSGNEEGLIPRFGVMLTRHMANFYNRISFEAVRAMDAAGMTEAMETLLVNAGNRCAFHTFGGIMASPEWDAVVRPSCKTTFDWVHGMMAVVNCLGWGTWRVTELSEQRAVFRIYDDYESTGWLAMYGEPRAGVSYLAQGGAAGLMNLVFPGRIETRPVLDQDFYDRVFDASDSFVARQVRSRSAGDAWTEIVAERSTPAK